MFDLEKALAAWRRSLTFNRTFQPEDVDELERHLRDQVKDLVGSGFSEEDAFRKARQEFGQYGDVEREYRKVRWESLSSRGRTMQELGARWTMLASYVRLALRSFRRNPLYFGLNLGGLTVGMAAALLIMLFIRHETHYDVFHPASERIFRVVKGGGTYTSAVLAPTLQADFPEIETSARISERWFRVRVRSEEVLDLEQRFYFADSTFFDLFGYPLVRGESANVLASPFSVVLTESAARKYFGQQDPVGRQINIKGLWEAYDFTVTGVAADMKGDSHFQFDFLASFDTRYQTGESPEQIESWMNVGDRTYIRLAEGTSIDSLQARMPFFLERHIPEATRNWWEKSGVGSFVFQPIREIHLDSQLDNEFGPGGNRNTLSIFMWVAAIVLMVAWMNYINMATAQSTKRAREVGVRKVVGAGRAQLVMQFLVESSLIMLLAGGAAATLTFLLLPWFGGLVGRELNADLLFEGKVAWMWVGLVFAGLLFAGALPSLQISRFRAAQVVKGLATKGASNAGFRRALVFTQFALSVVLLLGTGILVDQLDFLQQKRLGSNPDQVIVIQNDDAFDARTDDAFKERLTQHAGVVAVSAMTADIPLKTDMTMQLLAETPSGTAGEAPGSPPVFHTMVDHRFLQTMEIHLVEGRDFDPIESTVEVDRSYLPTILNQKAVEALGWEDPIGREFACCFRPTPRVVGVMEDFHFESTKEEIRPLAISPNWYSPRILVKVRPEMTASVLQYLSDTWKEMAPEWPLEWAFMDDQFAAAYTAEQRLADSFRLFSGLAVLIACLGLFGLATISVESRVREIGIRKAVGAKAEQVVRLVMMDLLKPIALALMVGLPFAGWLAYRWLQDYPYRIELGPWPFVQIAVLTLLVASVTISLHTWRAARINPADAIRHE